MTTRVGIHFGPAIVGRIGHPARQQLTAIGDTVNVASRVESQNKDLLTSLLITEECYAHVRDLVIVGVSGYGQEEHRLQSQQSGFDYHIVKPIDPPVLTGLLASLWSHRGPSAPENVVSFPQRKTAE